MTDPEPLTDEQLAGLSQSLRRLEAELQGALASSEDGSKPVDLETPIGRVSRIDAIQQQSMVQASRSASKARLRLVRQALAAVGARTFGYCRRCEEPVAYRRLRARPESAFCLGCQAAMER